MFLYNKFETFKDKLKVYLNNTYMFYNINTSKKKSELFIKFNN